ncbi:Glucose N-acetyltransferase [Lachnellula suecica]|uniref:Glucose N-acetyltransferase n=1 Tax=Lachnellula suecica TaxID=602035 RepID=A0A8T9C7H3_9HELO|nr:Glucose N-acetyltransferase [Lachnellula suecica]
MADASLRAKFPRGEKMLPEEVLDLGISKQLRVVAAASLILTIFAIFRSASSLSEGGSHLSLDSLKSNILLGLDSANADWSRFAYSQYATNSDYLCNSVMIFETLHRLGSKADRLLLYPSSMRTEPNSTDINARLLVKAQQVYGVKTKPIQVQHRGLGDGTCVGEDGKIERCTSEGATWKDSYTKLLAFNQTQYDRVLSLDSDSTVLQNMDELFLLPAAPVAMPRAYWLDKPYFSSQVLLIQPSTQEFKRIDAAIKQATTAEFDMEIVNNLYGKTCMVLPHRPYDLLTGEFRSGNHSAYLGNASEKWDPAEVLKEAKFLHFSDWPVPKPWVDGQHLMNEYQPLCKGLINGNEDCSERDLWRGFYADFEERRKRICNVDESVGDVGSKH